MCRYVSEESIPGDGAFVGLAPPGDVGSWQRECKVILPGPKLGRKKKKIQSIELTFIFRTRNSHMTFLKCLLHVNPINYIHKNHMF